MMLMLEPLTSPVAWIEDL